MKTQILATVIKETEKALNVEVSYKYLRDGSERTWKAWVPKSQSTVINEKVIEIPVWLAKKIDTEIADFQKQPKMNDVDFIIEIE